MCGARQRARDRQPLTLPRKLFEQAWQGRIILASPRACSTSAHGRFGFGWFIPAILKYRSLLLEVLAASFFIQLFALITPLFFQAVIDSEAGKRLPRSSANITSSRVATENALTIGADATEDLIVEMDRTNTTVVSILVGL